MGDGYERERLRTFRMADDDLWSRAREVAASRGESVSGVLRRALERYVKRYE